MNAICLDGNFMAAHQPVLMADDRCYRYGDGLFETMKVSAGRICNMTLHFERLWAGMRQLGFTIPKLLTPQKLEENIVHLCKKNDCLSLARIRLSVSAGTGGLYDGNDNLQYLIESWPLNESVNRLNENGLVIDIFPDARKGCDVFANLKSANFLPYSMAARYAKAHQLNDCIVLNQYERIADSTIATIFIVKKGEIFTPPLSEGCIAGVVRRILLEKKMAVEMPCTVNDMEEADEVFLTNSISGVRWVKQFRNNNYTNETAVKIYSELLQTIS